MSCVSNQFISWAGSISIGTSGNEVSKELSSESDRELSKDCERRSFVLSISESSGDCDNWVAVVSIGVSFGNWTTVSAVYVETGSLAILV